MVMVGLLHDMGKVLCLFDEPQWAVVGDTFPVGCAFSDKIVYPEFFSENPDRNNQLYNTKYGVYSPNCGLRNVHMSWGHDEYVYQMVKSQLPESGFTCCVTIRFMLNIVRMPMTISWTIMIMRCSGG